MFKTISHDSNDKESKLSPSDCQHLLAELKGRTKPNYKINDYNTHMI